MARKGLPKSIIKKYGISKKAWRIFRGRKKSRSRKVTRRKSNPKRRRRKLGRRKKRRGGKSLQRTLFKYMRIGALVAPQGYNMLKYPGDWERNVADFLYDYFGYNPADGSWKLERLAKGWGPFMAACLTTYGIPKLVGIIRRA